MATETSDKVRRTWTNAAKESRAPTDETNADWRARVLEAESADEQQLRAQLPAPVLELAVQLGGDKHKAAAEWIARAEKAAGLIERVNTAPMSALDEAVKEALKIGTVAENGGAGALIGIVARRMGLSQGLWHESLQPRAPEAARHWQELAKAFEQTEPEDRAKGRPSGRTGVKQYLELVEWASRDGLPARFAVKDQKQLPGGLARMLVAIGIPATRRPKKPWPHDVDVVRAGRAGFLPVGFVGPRVFGRVYLTEIEYATALKEWQRDQVAEFKRHISDAVRAEAERASKRSAANVEEKC